ncbi:MAG TPA: ArsI/CadI family heavy metal resistance metalloenzyme [Pirellulales bacterium]|nr:ArsI/CadI family heavy metal resistance metalloenzyme [Pirellulales bacterium]
MSTVATAARTRFHLSLNVSNLARSVEFLQALLGVPPAKLHDDYAKFEIDDPPLVLSLQPHGVGGGGALNHVGFRLADAAALVEAQRRLEAAGIATEREEGVECCYARQTKFWVHDPDDTLWEIYVVEGDIEHRGAGQSREAMGLAPLSAANGPAASAPERVTLSHRLGQPFPAALAADAARVDEVLLQGTFNAKWAPAERERILREVQRVLRPGGQLLVHVLTANRALSAAPKLPGPAAAVEHVPVDRELLAEVEAAGLVGIYLSKFGASPCFHHEGAEMRETKILSWKPRQGGTESRGTEFRVTEFRGIVLYKGPFREVSDETGRAFRRGDRVAVDAVTWDRLKAGPAAEQFLFLLPEVIPTPESKPC